MNSNSKNVQLLSIKALWCPRYNILIDAVHQNVVQKMYIAVYNKVNHASLYILQPSSYRSPYIFTLVQKVKHRVYNIHAFLNEAILC